MRWTLHWLAAALCLAATAAAGQVTTIGDIVIVQDSNGAITNNHTQSVTPTFCRDAFNAMRDAGIPDDFDGIFSFSTYEGWTDVQNTWMGIPVRYTAQGIGRSGPNPLGQGYNSSRLQQCVFMGTLGKLSAFPGFPAHEPLPPNPDDVVRAFGVFSGQTGVEMLGHEYGHHWLLGIEFDKNDGLGKRHLIRGCEGSEGEPCTPNQHYSARADSHSVMYGSFITDLGGGNFKLEGGVRKYGYLDQYLMGLRDPSEVPPMLVVDDGSGTGDPSQPLPKGSSTTVTGTRIDVTIQDVIRAMGPRIPAYPNTQKCWRVAFVVVLAPGQTTIPPAMLQKVEAYRQRWGPWFQFATDGRGTMDTRLNGQGCLQSPPDGGVVADAGTQAPDAGSDGGSSSEGGAGEDDAGSSNGESFEPPASFDAGRQPSKWETLEDDTQKVKPGCGCDAGTGLPLLALGALVFAARRSRRR